MLLPSPNGVFWRYILPVCRVVCPIADVYCQHVGLTDGQCTSKEIICSLFGASYILVIEDGRLLQKAGFRVFHCFLRKSVAMGLFTDASDAGAVSCAGIGSGTLEAAGVLSCTAAGAAVGTSKGFPDLHHLTVFQRWIRCQVLRCPWFQQTAMRWCCFLAYW